MARRISVVGVSGAGKTTLARALASAHRLAHLELDSVFHQAGWQPLPEEQFRARTTAFLRSSEDWVIDGNDSAVQPLVWREATDVVVLEPSRPRVMAQLVPRTVRRVLRREPLWNGNRESPRNLLSCDPQVSILAGAWTQHQPYRERYHAAAADPRWRHLRFLFVGSAEEAMARLDVVRAASSLV